MKVRYPALSPLGDDGEVILDNIAHSRHSKELVPLIHIHPKWTHGAEIGVAKGRNLKAILERTGIHMIAVDAFEYVGDSEDSGLYEKMDHGENEKCVMALAAAYPDRLQICKGDSVEVGNAAPREYFDFIFIDASHMYEEVKADILAWGPTVKKDGWILGHDYCEAWPGVVKAVDEILGRPLELPETMWAHQASALLEKF